VKLQKFDAATWVIFDLEDAPCFGAVTAGPWVMQNNGKLYARSGTYKLALAGVKAGGGAGGIKVDNEQRADGVATFVAGALELAQEGRFHADPGWNVGRDDLDPLAAHDPRNPVARAHTAELLAASAQVVAERAAGHLDGATVVLADLGPAGLALARRLLDAGAKLTGIEHRKGAVVDPAGIDADRLAAIAGGQEAPTGESGAARSSEADVYVAPGSIRAVEYGETDGIGARALMAVNDVVVTPRALHALRRRGVEVWPEIVSTLGPTVAEHAEAEDLAALERLVQERTAAVLDEAAADEEGPVLGACRVAEAFLSTWQPSLPFGRPMP
jgi:glutamate dehydrogenase (NAD(P)+)